VNKPELDAETIEVAAARVAAMNLSAYKPSLAEEVNAIRATKDLPPLGYAHGDTISPTRSPRSDKGTKRTPKAQTLSIEAVNAMTPKQAEELVRLVKQRGDFLGAWEDAKSEAASRELGFKAAAKDLQDFIEAFTV